MDACSATAGDGRLFRLQPDGKVETVAQIDASTSGAGRGDEARGVTYVAAAPGRLWAKTTIAISGSPLPDKDRAAASSIARKLFESDGSSWPCTAAKTVACTSELPTMPCLYRIDPAGGGRAIHDFAGNEVRAIAARRIAIHRGQRYVPAMRRRPRRPRSPPRQPAASLASGALAPGSPTARQPGRQESRKGALYRIEPSGRIEQLHAIVDGFFNGPGRRCARRGLRRRVDPGGRSRLYG